MVKIHTLIALLIMTMNSGFVKASEFTKSYDKSYDINKGAVLSLDCSFANVDVSTHESDKIDIHIDVIVKGSPENKVQKVFEQIEVKLIGSPSKVEVITHLGKNNLKNVSFDIKIAIKAPSHIVLDADMSFGNLDLATIQGKATVNLQYGNLRARELFNSNNELGVSFGNLRIYQFKGGKVDVDFGDLRIEQLIGNSEISSSYGNVGVDLIDPACTSLDVSSEFGNAEINLSPTSSFRITASSAMGEIDWDSMIKVTKEKNDMTSNKIEASIGTGSGTLVASSSFGNLKLKVR